MKTLFCRTLFEKGKRGEVKYMQVQKTFPDSQMAIIMMMLQTLNFWPWYTAKPSKLPTLPAVPLVLVSTSAHSP